MGWVQQQQDLTLHCLLLPIFGIFHHFALVKDPALVPAKPHYNNYQLMLPTNTQYLQFKNKSAVKGFVRKF